MTTTNLPDTQTARVAKRLQLLLDKCCDGDVTLSELWECHMRGYTKLDSDRAQTALPLVSIKQGESPNELAPCVTLTSIIEVTVYMDGTSLLEITTLPNTEQR